MKPAFADMDPPQLFMIWHEGEGEWKHCGQPSEPITSRSGGQGDDLRYGVPDIHELLLFNIYAGRYRGRIIFALFFDS
jgi:hypothetical protein